MLLNYIKQDKLKLDLLQDSFTHINHVYRDFIEAELQPNIGTPPSAPVLPKNLVTHRVLIKQEDMMIDLFQKLDPEKDLAKIERLLISYLASLSECNILAQYNLTELLVTCLVSYKSKLKIRERNKFLNLIGKAEEIHSPSTDATVWSDCRF